MSRTQDLRALITAELNTTTGVTYYRQAPADAALPYKVFNLTRLTLNEDTARNDFEVTIDIWGRGNDMKSLEDIAEGIEDRLSNANLPQTGILPTFYFNTRYPVDDADRDIQHLQMTFEVNLYERE